VNWINNKVLGYFKGGEMKLMMSVFVLTMLFFFNITQAATIYTDETNFINAVGPQHTLVNFDTDTSGDPIVTDTQVDLQYLSVGVDFNAFNGGVPIAKDRFALSTPNNLQAVPGSGGGGGFEAVFINPLYGAGLQVGDLQDLNFGNTILEIFDANNISLGAFNLFDELGDGELIYLFFGITSDTPISKLQVAIGINDNVVFDDFRIKPVPLPSAIWLLGTCLLGFLGLRKIKSNR
jgi:hypothetical protein